MSKVPASLRGSYSRAQLGTCARAQLRAPGHARSQLRTLAQISAAAGPAGLPCVELDGQCDACGHQARGCALAVYSTHRASRLCSRVPACVLARSFPASIRHCHAADGIGCSM